MALYYVNGGANQGTWRKTPTANPKSIRLEVKTDQSYWIKPSPFNIGGKSAWSKRASSNNSASGCFHFLPFGEKKNQSMLPVRAIDCWIRSKQILAKNYALGSLVSNKAYSTFRGSDFVWGQSVNMLDKLDFKNSPYPTADINCLGISTFFGISTLFYNWIAPGQNSVEPNTCGLPFWIYSAYFSFPCLLQFSHKTQLST